MKSTFKISLLALFALAASLNVFSQETKKILTLEDYPLWKAIVSPGISDDGNWMIYSFRPNDGDDTLYIKNVQSEKIYYDPFCSNAAFSPDSKWVAYKRNLPKKEAEKLKKNKKDVFSKGVLLNLETGEKSKWDKIKSLTFSPAGNVLLLQKESADKEAKSSDLLVKNLNNGSLMNIGNVSDFKFNSQGTQFAYIVDAADKAGNGVYLADIELGKIIPLNTDTTTFSRLVWDDEMLYESERGSKGTALAVLSGNTPDSLEQRINSLLVFTDLNTENPKQIIYSPEKDKNFPADYVISEKGKLEFGLDNQNMVVPIREQAKKEKLSRDSVANVDVWHWDDETIQSVQMARSRRAMNETYTGILHLGNLNFVQLTSDSMRQVELNRNADLAVGGNPKPYISDLNWGGGQSDFYLLDTKTGAKTLIAKKIGRSMGLSPQGTTFLYFKDGHFFAYDLLQKKLTNISKAVDAGFTDINEDHPYENPSYGMAAWSKDNKTVFLNHNYDLWALALDGSGGYNLTGNYGNKNEIRFRIARTSNDPTLDLANDIYLTAYGEWTKKSGFYKLNDGKAPEQLVFDDYSFGRIMKAKDSDRFLFTRESFVDFPDLYTTDAKFKKLSRQTDANPQQADYRWGTRKLIDFENKDGERLQATLTLPAGYEEGKKYPMLVYFYEKMSNRHNLYSMPIYDDRPHFSAYASDGYLILMPDIKYKTGQPGWNALDCVTSAVKKVMELGYPDPAHIGMQGHSWGGYQSSFILTQTDMFAATVTGAPVTNLTSMYDILYKNTGTNNQGIIEKGQVRMGKGMFEDFQNYVEQSPVFNADKIKTPFMILHGTADGAVDWNQGLEFYNAARRLGKEVILLSYPGENHHLAVKNNQIDFQTRMKQFFDHYLKGSEAPTWMKEGIPQTDKLYEKAK